MSNANDIKGELELTAEDLEWIAKYGDDPEFIDNSEVDMADEDHPEDQDQDKAALEAEALAKQKADEEARLLAEKQASEAAEAAKKAEQTTQVDEEAEQQIYASLLSLNDKQEELAESLKSNTDALQAKETELSEIAKKFDDGELGQGEYDVAKARLTDELSELKKQVKLLTDEEKETKKQLEAAAVKVDELAQLTQKREESSKAMAEQAQKQWNTDCEAFLSKAENKVFVDKPELQEELASFVTTLSQRAVKKGVQIDNNNLLSQARKAVAALYEDIPPESQPSKKPEPPKKELPRTLGGMSAASNPSVTVKDEFADLENMTPAERDAAMLAVPREQMKRWARGGN